MTLSQEQPAHKQNHNEKGAVLFTKGNTVFIALAL
jgi:hypothetical protein